MRKPVFILLAAIATLGLTAKAERPFSQLATAKTTIINEEASTIYQLKQEPNEIFIGQDNHDKNLIYEVAPENGKPFIKKISIGGGDEPTGPTYKVAVNIPRPDLENFKFSTCLLSDLEKNKVVAQANPESDWDYNAPLMATKELPAGQYGCWALGQVETEQLPFYYPVQYYVEFEVTDADTEVEIDFNKSTIHLEIDGVMGDGDPFPATNPEPGMEDRDFTMFSATMSIGMMYVQYSFWGGTDFFLMTNELGNDSSYVCNFLYMDFDSMEMSQIGIGMRGPFTKDAYGKVTQDMYTKFINKTSLSSEDMRLPMVSMGFGNNNMQLYTLEDGKIGVYINKMDSMWGVEGEQIGNMIAYLPLSPMHLQNYDVWEPTVHTAFYGAGYYNRDWGMTDMIPKASGNILKYPNGKLVIVGGESGKNAKYGQHSFISPSEIFNIDPETQDVVNFLNPLYCNNKYNIYTDEAGNITNVGSIIYFEGPFHEQMEVSEFNPGPYGVITEGDKQISIYDLFGTPAKGRTFKISTIYENGMAQGCFPVTYNGESQICTDSEDDWSAPFITGYQVRNSNNKITGFLKEGEEAFLFVGTRDQKNKLSENLDFTTTVSIAPEGTEDWTVLNGTCETVGGCTGNLNTYALNGADIQTDTWYKVKIYVEDQCGNYSTSTLNYCFQIASQRDLYVVGTMTGWSINPDYKFTLNNDGTYSLNLDELKGSFKISTSDKEGNVDWAAADFGGGFNLENGSYSLVWEGSNMEIAMSSLSLTLTYDADAQTFIMEVEGTQMPVEPLEIGDLYIVGTMTNWEIDPAYKLSYKDGSYSFTTSSLNGKFKIAGEPLWEGVDLGAPQETTLSEGQEGLELVNGGKDIAIEISEGANIKVTVAEDGKSGHISYTFTNAVNSLNPDDEKVAWFNLQGLPVENPENGIFIRVSGTKAEKVTVK